MEIPLQVLIAVMNIVIAGQIAIIAWIVKQIMEIKQNYLKQFGEVKLKIEESKNLMLQENQTTATLLGTKSKKVYTDMATDFVNKHDCERRID
jgi:hypothetical protein